MDSRKNVERVARCRAKLKRVELLFHPEEYAQIVDAAGGEAVAAYIKETVRRRMNQDGAQHEGI